MKLYVLVLALALATTPALASKDNTPEKIINSWWSHNQN
jgi:hypothetical protein